MICRAFYHCPIRKIITRFNQTKFFFHYFVVVIVVAVVQSESMSQTNTAGNLILWKIIGAMNRNAQFINWVKKSKSSSGSDNSNNKFVSSLKRNNPIPSMYGQSKNKITHKLLYSHACVCERANCWCCSFSVVAVIVHVLIFVCGHCQFIRFPFVTKPSCQAKWNEVNRIETQRNKNWRNVCEKKSNSPKIGVL